MLITMDRYEAEWDMVERGWAHHGEGRRFPGEIAIKTCAMKRMRSTSTATSSWRCKRTHRHH